MGGMRHTSGAEKGRLRRARDLGGSGRRGGRGVGGGGGAEGVDVVEDEEGGGRAPCLCDLRERQGRDKEEKEAED